MVDICLHLFLTGVAEKIYSMILQVWMNKGICIGIVLALAREYVCDCSFKTGVGGEELFYKHKEQECIGMKIILFGGYVCISLSLTGTYWKEAHNEGIVVVLVGGYVYVCSWQELEEKLFCKQEWKRRVSEKKN